MDRISKLITYTDKFLVVLDSRNATNFLNDSFNSNIIFEFAEPIALPKHAIVMTCSVLSFTCANSIYNINETNNKLNILIGSTNYNINIPFGNYDAYTIVTTLSTYLPATFLINLNSINNIFTFTYSVSSFSILSSSTCGDILGFVNGTRYNSIANNIVLPYTCNFNGLQNINVVIENINTRNFDSYTKSNSSIIQPIPISFNTSQILYQKSNDYAFSISQDSLDSLHIKLQDDLQNLINLNNQHFNLTLCFSVYQDIDRFRHDNSFTNIIKYGKNPIIYDSD